MPDAFRWLTAIMFFLLAGHPLFALQNIDIIPRPQSVTPGSGQLRLDAESRIYFDSRDIGGSLEDSLQPLANVLADDIELISGLRPAVRPLSEQANLPGSIVLRFQPIQDSVAETEAEQDQAYELDVSDHVTVSSQYYKGVAYGTASLIQLIQCDRNNCHVPRLIIRDQPVASYRSIMLDIARLPHSLNTLRDTINLARLYKIRYLHLHLTDDQNFTFPFQPVISGLEEKGVKNTSFTRQELIDLVQYADERGVTIIPELDLPGHSRKLTQSGFIVDDPDIDGFGHADVASEKNYQQIEKIIDDMLDVFGSSPYFHIGGDESQAGHRLEPFLAHINRFLRSKPVNERKRMLVWEGFRGAPTELLPAEGEDRVIVMVWEGGAYNTPWNLLKHRYTVINSSWKPLYIVGGGNPRLPHYSTRRWPARTIYKWNSSQFIHWQPGVPIYHDRGPSDPDRTDSMWDASYVDGQDLVLGGQLQFWEHSEKIVIRDFHERIPAFSDRLWNPQSDRPYSEFRQIQERLYDRIMTLIHPIEILPDSLDPESPISDDYAIYQGDRIKLTLRNRSRIKGEIKYELSGVRRQISNFESAPLKFATRDSKTWRSAFEVDRQGFAISAGLFREDGTAIRGQSYKIYNNFPQTVRYTNYARTRDEFPAAEREIPDFQTFIGKRTVTETGDTPWLRGNWTHTERSLQRQDAIWQVQKPGTYRLECKADSGRASVYVDLNQNDQWDETEKLITTLPKEERVSVELSLQPGHYRVRIDHVTELVRPVLIASIVGPDSDNQRRDLSHFLVPLNEYGKDLSPKK